SNSMNIQISADRLVGELKESRRRTLELVADLDDDQMIGPRLGIVNPLRWEIGHVAWFQEYWVLRHLCGRDPILPHGDTLYDSARIAHDTRWDLPLPSKSETIGYTTRVLNDVERYIPARGDSAEYFLSLALLHEDMHGEAITYTRQTLAYSAPQLSSQSINRKEANTAANGDVSIPGGPFLLGNTSSEGF